MMKYRIFYLLAAALLLFSGCSRWQNDNPAFSTHPADSIEDLKPMPQIENAAQ